MKKNLFLLVNLDLENGQIETILENEKFSFEQMHFHWNHSEHAINSKRYAAELHLVHRSFLDENKFAVLGFLFQVIKKKKKNFNKNFFFFFF